MKKILLFLIGAYQKYFLEFCGVLIKPFFYADCKYYPSCSSYARQAIERFGWRQGAWRSFKRILRCHPWAEGGVDFI